jgi:hypothetical protein
MSDVAPPGAVDPHVEVKKRHPKVTGAELIELQRQFDCYDTDGSGEYVPFQTQTNQQCIFVQVA